MPFPEPCLFSPTAAAARGLSTRGDMGGVNVPDPVREDREPVDLRVSMAAFLHTYTGWNCHFISHHYIHLQCKPFVKTSAQNFLPKPFMQIVSMLINNGLLVWMLRSFYVHACNILISYISGTLQHKKMKCVKIKSWTFLVSIQNIQSLL